MFCLSYPLLSKRGLFWWTSIEPHTRFVHASTMMVTSQVQKTLFSLTKNWNNKIHCLRLKPVHSQGDKRVKKTLVWDRLRGSTCLIVSSISSLTKFQAIKRKEKTCWTERLIWSFTALCWSRFLSIFLLEDETEDKSYKTIVKYATFCKVQQKKTHTCLPKEKGTYLYLIICCICFLMVRIKSITQ